MGVNKHQLENEDDLDILEVDNVAVRDSQIKRLESIRASRDSAAVEQALADIKRDAMRAGMIPSINGMASAGIVALPGMMTGQILAGSSPIEAVKYQILILFLISAGSGFGIYASLKLGSRHLFDKRHRLRLERIKSD